MYESLRTNISSFVHKVNGCGLYGWGLIPCRGDFCSPPRQDRLKFDSGQPVGSEGPYLGGKATGARSVSLVLYGQVINSSRKNFGIEILRII
jgi:hypothetical protein